MINKQKTWIDNNISHLKLYTDKSYTSTSFDELLVLKLKAHVKKRLNYFVLYLKIRQNDKIRQNP